MSIDEFHVMAHQVGWKHEYWDGMAQLSPHASAVADWVLPLDGDATSAGEAAADALGKLREVRPTDAKQLEHLHLAIFDQAIEYAGYSDEYYHRSTHESIAGYFGEKKRRSRGALEHSHVLDSDGEVVAAILIRHEGEQFVIEPVMVKAACQRRGIGRRLLRCAVDSLRNAGIKHLHSRCHLGNSTSLKWHEANGFEQHLNFLAAGHLAMHHAWMSRHHAAEGRMEQSQLDKRFADLYFQLRHALQDLEMCKFREPAQ